MSSFSSFYTLQYKYNLLQPIFLELYMYKISKCGTLITGFGHNLPMNAHGSNNIVLSINILQVLLKVEEHDE